MTEYIIRHEQLEKIFDWIDKLTIAAYGEEYEGLIGKRLALFEYMEVPPLVRCKDCENWCIDTCQLFPTVDEPNGFCACGRREEEDQ